MPKIEQEKRRERREDIIEQELVLQQGRMMNRVTEHEAIPPESGHGRQEEGVDEGLSPMEEHLWIEHGRALQVDIPQTITPHFP